MKNLILITAFVLTSAVSFGQGAFDKYLTQDGVTRVVVKQKMIKMLATMGQDLDDPEVKKLGEMASKITGLKVFTTGDESIAKDMNKTVNKHIKSSNLEELMSISDGGQNVIFYFKEGRDENHVKEFLMFITGLKELTNGQDISINGQKREIESVIMTLTGDIDLRQISKLANQMNLPGGEQLKKAEKKN